MSLELRSLISIDQISSKDSFFLFQKTKDMKTHFLEFKNFDDYFKPGPKKIVNLVFFEPSTRTRHSFELAALRLNHSPVSLGASENSSMVKGESYIETVNTMLRLYPDLLVVRHKQNPALTAHLNKIDIPVLNAGSGSEEHPTQALLDAFTIYEHFGDLSGVKVLIVGDVLHSRVANSNLKLLQLLGAEIAISCPGLFLPKETHWRVCEYFEKLEDGLEWADVCMGLRIQKERHSEPQMLETLEDYKRDFMLTKEKLAYFSKKGIVMHPGPFVAGEDLELGVLEDERCRIHQQVSNGFFIRAALMSHFLKMEKK